MAKFNIEGSKIEQLNETGNNYKVVNEKGNIAISEKGSAVVTAGDQNKVTVDRPKTGFVSLLCAKVKALWKWFTG